MEKKYSGINFTNWKTYLEQCYQKYYEYHSKKHMKKLLQLCIISQETTFLAYYGHRFASDTSLFQGNEVPVKLF